MRRLALAALVVAFAIVLPARAASAHAILEATSPADRSHLDAGPSVVTLTFSEDVRAALGAVKVFDDKGGRVDNGNLTVSGSTITLGLNSGIGDGGYIVTWRAISADSHPVSGAFTFSVGTGQDPSDSAVAGVFDKGGDKPWQIAGAIGRWLMYGGVLLAAGGAVFLAVVHDGAETDRRRLRRIVVGAAIAGAAGVLVAIPIQAELATGLGLASFTKPGVLRDVVADGVGPSSLLVLLGLVAVVLGCLGATSVARRVVAVAGAALATGAFALAGHTTETSPKWVAMVADVTHLWAAASWFGGLVLLVFVLRARRGDPVSAGRLVARFSRVATVSLVIVSIAGGVLAYTEVKAVKALTTTTYGWVLIAKIAAVAAVAAAGAYNHFRLVPALESAPKKAARLLGRTVRLEAGAMVGVLLLAAVLVSVTPARTAAGLTGIYSATQPLGTGSINLVVDPDRAGTNSMHAYVLDDAGRNIDVVSIEIDASLPANGIAAITSTPFAAGPGHYQVDGLQLPITGTWTIEVKARVSKFEEETATFEVPVHP